MTAESDYRWLDVSPDYRGRLQEFECAVPLDGFFDGAVKRHGSYYWPWELEVQNTIRNFRKCTERDSQWAHIMVSPNSEGADCIWSFVWFGIVGGTRNDSNGDYVIGYIARALGVFRSGYGDATLKHALRVLKEDHARTGREDAIGARIDPRNTASMSLFARNGFVDAGPDPEATEYHRWIRFGFDNL